MDMAAAIMNPGINPAAKRGDNRADGGRSRRNTGAEFMVITRIIHRFHFNNPQPCGISHSGAGHSGKNNA